MSKTRSSSPGAEVLSSGSAERKKSQKNIPVNFSRIMEFAISIKISGHIGIRYELDSNSEIKRFNLADWEIAPLGTYTEDFEWRYNLQPGDKIDCLDEEKDWYKATVINVRQRKNAKNEVIPEILVGFRTYNYDGSKKDDEGRFFSGWSSKYDNWYAVTSPLV